MSIYTTFKTYDEVIKYLAAVDHPQCFTVNYKPDTKEYALWIGNQPYYVYEEWIEEAEQKYKELKKENKKLELKLSKTKELVKNIQTIQELRKELAIKTAPNHSLLDLYRR